jgi:hypothetical protein
MQMSLDSRAEPPLASDELVAIPYRADQDGLDHPVLPKRIGQGADLDRVELASRLERIRVDQADANVCQLGGVDRARFISPLIAAEKSFQAATESALIHVR